MARPATTAAQLPLHNHMITLARTPAASSAPSTFFFAHAKRGQGSAASPTASAQYTAIGRPSAPRPMPCET